MLLLNSPLLPSNPFPAQHTFLEKLTSSSAWGALATYPYKLHQNIFSLWGCACTNSPSWLLICEIFT